MMKLLAALILLVELVAGDGQAAFYPEHDQALKVFSNAPQVKGIVIASWDEKLAKKSFDSVNECSEESNIDDPIARLIHGSNKVDLASTMLECAERFEEYVLRGEPATKANPAKYNVGCAYKDCYGTIFNTCSWQKK